ASYFYEQDRKTPLEAMAEKLERLLFQEKLGTMADKRARLELLAASLSDSLGADPGDRKAAIRAAFLCKGDLVSQMVLELPAHPPASRAPRRASSRSSRASPPCRRSCSWRPPPRRPINR